MASFEEAIKNFGVDSAVVVQAKNLNTPLEQYVEEASQVFIELMQQRLDKGAPDMAGAVNASYRLRQSLMIEGSVSEGVIGSEFTSDEKYVLWRNDGVSGTEQMRQTEYAFKSPHPSLAMVTDIEQWMNAKGFEAPAWAVATNVLKYGYDGARYIEAAFSEENLAIFERDLLIVVDNTVFGLMKKVVPEFK